MSELDIFDGGILSASNEPKTQSIFNDPSRFMNRELSWLEFNRRVLEEARNYKNPLLERLRFLSISASNLDEFFMVRVAGLMAQAAQGVASSSADGLSAKQQLKLVSSAVSQLQDDQQDYWKLLQEELREENIFIIHPTDLADAELQWLKEYFLANIFPVLTPLSMDLAHPFPFISNLGQALVLELQNTRTDNVMNAFIRLPQGVTRFIQLPERDYGHTHYLKIDDVIEAFIDVLYPGHTINEFGSFRVIRDSDLEVEEEAEDLVLTFEIALKRRRRGNVIRIETDSKMSEKLHQFIISKLHSTGVEFVVLGEILALNNLAEIVETDRPDLKYNSYIPRFPERVREHDDDCLAAIHKKDILVHHPYESFDVVVQFLRQAAHDPDVLAIKQTLYRTSNESPIISALIEAAEAGKSVVAVIELKARFDEEANLRWSRDLERAGVQVVFGFLGWKTHSKLSLVVRREEDGIRNYVHIGTGNYHPITAKIYTDLSYFTSNALIANEVVRVFNYITGYAEPKAIKQLSISPLYLKEKLIQHIEDEIAHANKNDTGHIWAKMNALVDPDIIDAFYRASQAGVKIELIIRGICCLRPNVIGMSENIAVKSIVGRFLEHSRIICFGNGEMLPSDRAIVYMGSADLMPRNLVRRVETMVRLENETVRQQVLDQIMLANIKDTALSWEILPDGTSRRINSENDSESFNCQTYFMTNPSLSGRGEALKTNAPKRFIHSWSASGRTED